MNEYRRNLINQMSVVKTIDIVNWYAVFSAWLAHYYDRAINETQYDQDYAVNNGIVYG